MRYTNIESTCETDSAREQKHQPDAAATYAHLPLAALLPCSEAFKLTAFRIG